MAATDDSARLRIAVIGGGISGLAAALEIHRRSPTSDVVLFEASTALGGVIQTERRGDLLMERGPDGFLRALPWATKLCGDLGLAPDLIPTQPSAAGVYTVFRGKLVRMPEGLAAMAPQRIWPMVRTPILSPWGKLRMGAERLLPRRRDGADESLAQFARRRFGAEGLARIIQPLAGGIYMGDPERLGMRAAFPQLVAAERECGSLIKSCRITARRAKRNPKPPGETLFASFRGGISQLVDSIVAALPTDSIRLGQQVESLARTASGWRIAGQDSRGAPFAEEFAKVVVAAPAPRAAPLFAPLDRTLAELLGGIAHTSCVVVNLAYPLAAIRRPLDAAGIIVPHVERRPIAACTFSSVKYAGRAPAGIVLLRAFLGGVQHPEIVGAPDDAILARARGEVESLLAIGAPPIHEQITRWRDTMPQYYVGHLDRVAQIDERIAALPNLELTGNAYRGVGIPHCINQAQQAVERLLGASVRSSAPIAGEQQTSATTSSR